jgi:hypothetical protein
MRRFANEAVRSCNLNDFRALIATSRFFKAHTFGRFIATLVAIGRPCVSARLGQRCSWRWQVMKVGSDMGYYLQSSALKNVTKNLFDFEKNDAKFDDGHFPVLAVKSGPVLGTLVQ